MITLQINQQFARIGLNINDASYELNKKQPNLQIDQINPNVQVRTSQPNLEIDSSSMRESMGFGGIWFMHQSLKANADAEFQQDLETIVQMGRQIGEIENNVPIGQVVFQAMVPPENEVTIASLAPIEIQYTPAEVHSNLQQGDVHYSTDLGEVSIDGFKYPFVRSFIEQQAYLEIKAVGQAIDIKQ
ncbi:MAG: hypothetical protein FNP40_07170 [Dehalobacter sp. 4CP]|uniref:DUF6470 family protein n=1 Tax=Dehalobacter sp. CP TaxID=2594474 RepID=UPI0013CD3289|nr:hypothetical protein [Dehalobacter sp. 4CP]